MKPEMKRDNPDSSTEDPEARAARVAELKAMFEAGTLQVDEKALASKLVDLHLKSELFDKPI